MNAKAERTPTGWRVTIDVDESELDEDRPWLNSERVGDAAMDAIYDADPVDN